MKTHVLSIDPGTDHSGVSLYDIQRHKIIIKGDYDNRELLEQLRDCSILPDGVDPKSVIMVIEGMEAQFKMVGASTFETAEWIGWFREAWDYQGLDHFKIYRKEVKLNMCGGNIVRNDDGTKTAVKDAQISSAVRGRFPATGGGSRPEIGTKNQPGPLYGAKGSHVFSAIAIALTWVDMYHGNGGN